MFKRKWLPQRNIIQGVISMRKPFEPMILNIEVEYLPKDWAKNLMNKIIWGDEEAYYDGALKDKIQKYEKQIQEIKKELI